MADATVTDRIKQDIANHPVVLYMKGTPVFPQCGFSAAVVMSHHLPSDLAYLRTLGATEIPYVGLLGPAVRRERLLSDLGPAAQTLRGRLRAPVGLPLGGRSPESIALAIVAELHAFIQATSGPATARA